MTHFFDRKDRWGNGLAVWVVMAMVFVAPLAWWSIGQTRLENDVEKWLPGDDPELKILHWANSHFPVEERIFVSWDGSSLNDPRIQSFVEKLQGTLDTNGIRRGGDPHIARVVEPRELLYVMEKNGVEPREAIRRLEGLILGAGSLKLKLTEFGKSGLKRTIQELKDVARNRFGIDLNFSDSIPDFWTQVAIPAPPAEEGETRSDPAAPAVMNGAGQMIELESVEHDLQVVWKGIRPATEKTIEITDWFTQYVAAKDQDQRLVERCFFAMGSPVTIAVSISEAGRADKDETVSVIRRAANDAGISPETLRLGGSAISTTELNHEVQKAVWDQSFPLRQFHRRSVLLTSAILSRDSCVHPGSQHPAGDHRAFRLTLCDVDFHGTDSRVGGNNEHGVDCDAVPADGAHIVRRDPCGQLLEACRVQGRGDCNPRGRTDILAAMSVSQLNDGHRADIALYQSINPGS